MQRLSHVGLTASTPTELFPRDGIFWIAHSFHVCDCPSLLKGEGDCDACCTTVRALEVAVDARSYARFTALDDASRVNCVPANALRFLVLSPCIYRKDMGGSNYGGHHRVAPWLLPSTTTLLAFMERHQQENRNGKPMVVTSVQDPSFAPSTIHRRLANPQASTETRRSRDGQTLRHEMARGNIKPSPESSEDELALGWSPAKPATSKKRVIATVKKPKSPTKPKQTKQKPEGSSKATAVRTQSRNKDDALEEDDAPHIGLEALIREKQPRSTSNQKQPPSTNTKNGRMQGTHGNSKPIDVIEELSDSPDLGDISWDEGRDRARARPLKPRPFPMDLSSPIRKHAQPGTASLTPNSASPPGSRGAAVSKMATTNLHASSES